MCNLELERQKYSSGEDHIKKEDFREIEKASSSKDSTEPRLEKN